MALDSTYTGLKASVADWLNRDDLTAQIPDFILLAEKRLFIELRYFGAITSLASTTTNEILSSVPGAYLYGALLEAAPFLEHDERVKTWQAKYDGIIETMNEFRGWQSANTTTTLDSYANLQTAIAKALNRNDLVSEIPSYIALAEKELARRLRYNSTRSTLSITSQTTTLASGVAELRSIQLVTGTPHLDRPLNVVTPEVISEMRALQGGQVGRPRWASIVGQTLDVAPAPDQTYTANIIYYDALTPLSTSNTTNEQFTLAPDAYFYGALVQASAILEKDPRIPMWQDMFDKAVYQLNVMKDNQEHSASLGPVRLPVVF